MSIPAPERVRWILCDLGKVLVNFDHRTIAKNVLRFAAEHPDCLDANQGALTPERLLQFFFHDMSRGDTRNKLLDRGRLSLGELCKDVEQALGWRVTAEVLAPLWADIFTDFLEPTAEAMRRARARGLKVAICSATNAAHWEHIWRRYPQLHGLADRHFLSYEMGATKSDHGFFIQIAESTGCAPEEHYFLDDIQENVDQALREGMQAELFTGQVPKQPFFEPLS